MSVDYGALSYAELVEEIEREERELEGLRSEVADSQAYLELELLAEAERVRSRWRYWRRELEEVRFEIRDSRSRLSWVLDRIRGLERDILGLRRRLSFVGRYERAVIEDLVRGYGEEKGSRWSEWSNIMGRIRYELRPREREAEERHVSELEEYGILREEVGEVKRRIREILEKAEVIETEIEIKKSYLTVEIVEVTCYCNYIQGMKGGKGKDKEFKTLKWIKKGEEIEYESEMRHIWFRVYDFLSPYLDDYDVEYGRTNREDEVDLKEFEDFEEYILALIIETATGKELQRGEGTIDDIEREGYFGIKWRKSIKYYHWSP